MLGVHIFESRKKSVQSHLYRLNICYLDEMHNDGCFKMLESKDRVVRNNDTGA